MKEIFLILDHSNTEEKKQNTINLVKKIKKNYEVALATHIFFDDYLIQNLDYFFYDKKNELSYNINLKPYWFYLTDNFKLKYKPFKFSSLHITAILRMLFPSLNYLKNLGYDIVHVIEYDTIIKNFKIFEKNTYELKKGYDFLGFQKNYVDGRYTQTGEIFSLLLNNISQELLTYDFNTIEEYFIKQEYETQLIQEFYFFDNFVKKLKFKLLDHDLMNESCKYNTQSITDEITEIENRICIYEYQGEFFLFVSNITDSIQQINVIVDKLIEHPFQIQPYCWIYRNLTNKKNSVFDLYVNGEHLITIDNNSEYIKSAKFELI